MLLKIIFSLGFRYFKEISDKVTADDDVTCMITSSSFKAVNPPASYGGLQYLKLNYNF